MRRLIALRTDALFAAARLVVRETRLEKCLRSMESSERMAVDAVPRVLVDSLARQFARSSGIPVLRLTNSSKSATSRELACS
jgi:hypothetical protein